MIHRFPRPGGGRSGLIQAARNYLSMPGVPVRRRLPRYGIILVMLFTLFGGDRGMLRLVGLLRDRAALRADVRELSARRLILETNLSRATTDREAIERTAREDLDMIKKGETVYKFPQE